MPQDQVERERSSSNLPDRTLIQRMQALEIGNYVRAQRAQLKRDLKTGQVSIHDILLEPPAWIETMKVFDVLMALPGYGRVKVNRILGFCRISSSKTIGGMSVRQRYELAAMAKRPR